MYDILLARFQQSLRGGNQERIVWVPVTTFNVTLPALQSALNGVID